MDETRFNMLDPSRIMAQVVPSTLGETFDCAASGPAGDARGHSVCPSPAAELPLEAFLVSTGVVALAEIGDKTQLLAFVLAARFRKPVPIVLGILVATLVNHAFAGALGAWLIALPVAGPAALGPRPVVPRDGRLDADPRQARR